MNLQPVLSPASLGAAAERHAKLSLERFQTEFKEREKAGY